MNISQKADVYLRPPTADRLRKGRLALQPGWYGAGHPRLDRIHQKLRKIPGVLGSRTEGAGMGGTIVVLAKKAGGDEILRLFPKAWRVSPGPPASVLPK